MLTVIAVVPVNSTMPDSFHLSGNVRFKFRHDRDFE
jgi:hypothetical protein